MECPGGWGCGLGGSLVLFFWLWRTSRRGLGFLVSTQVGAVLGAFLGGRVAAFGAGGAAGGVGGFASRRG